MQRGILSAEGIAEKLKAFRKTKGWNQAELAGACGGTQSQISRWESGRDRPSGAALFAIAEIVPQDDREWWRSQALSDDKVFSITSHMKVETDLQIVREDRPRLIPLLRDAAAAGTPREIDEREIEDTIAFPKRWIRRGGTLYAVKVAGDSMEPILLDGHIAIIDTSSKDPSKLVNKMVAARDNGVTVKGLRFQDDTYLLVPQNVSVRHPVRLINSKSGVEIIGEVVKWIGEPPPARK